MSETHERCLSDASLRETVRNAHKSRRRLLMERDRIQAAINKLEAQEYEALEEIVRRVEEGQHSDF